MFSYYGVPIKMIEQIKQYSKSKLIHINENKVKQNNTSGHMSNYKKFPTNCPLNLPT